MKKNKFPLLLILGALVLPGCQNKDENKYPLTKVADHLYQYVLEDDINWSSANALTNMNKRFACSGVQNGKFRGRNYDWYYDDTDLCIVQSKKTANRKHASVGVSDLSFLKKDEKGHYDLEKIPLVTVDGINDAGLCIQVNVLTYGENGVNFVHTEDTSDDLHGARVVRYILDNADSVDNAIALLKQKDIDSTYYGAEEFHWLISGPVSADDKTIKTVVVEKFPSDYAKFAEINETQGLAITDTFVDNKPIMTNLNVHNFDGTSSTVGYGLGFERWQLLDKYYNQGTSIMGMFDLMEKVWYSKFYDFYGELFWYSEFALTALDQTTYYSAHLDELKNKLDELLGAGTYDYMMENYGHIYYLPEMWGASGPINGDTSKAGIIGPCLEVTSSMYNAQNLGNELWITVHTSVYDLEAKQLNIQVRESQDVLTFEIA